METEVTFSMPGNGDERKAIMNKGSTDIAYGIILGHGAGGNSKSGNLPQIAESFADAGFWCLRFDYAPPNLQGRVKCCEALLRHAQGLNRQGKLPVKKWIFAGHSMGGRVASAVAHSNPDATLGCILFSYPLHPPNKQEQLRDDPLTALKAPVLFVRGTKDNFCDERVFEAVKGRMESATVEVHEVESGDHSLKVRGGKAATANAVTQAIAATVHFAQRLVQEDTSRQGSASEAKEEQPKVQVKEAAAKSPKKKECTGSGHCETAPKKRSRR